VVGYFEAMPRTTWMKKEKRTQDDDKLLKCSTYINKQWEGSIGYLWLKLFPTHTITTKLFTGNIYFCKCSSLPRVIIFSLYI
jgi:hypothetical protein